MMRRWNKALALMLALAMLLSAFALAEDVGIGIDWEDSGEFELEIEGAAQDEGVDIDEVAAEEEILEPEDSELALDLDPAADGLALDDEGLELLDEELDLVAGAAKAAGTGTQGDPIEISDWSQLVNAMAQSAPAGKGAEHPTYYQLTGNAGYVPGQQVITVATGRYVVLDLHGHTVNGEQSGSVITIEGDLTVTDGSAGGSGKITRGNTNNVGGVYVMEISSFVQSENTQKSVRYWY